MAINIVYRFIRKKQDSCTWYSSIGVVRDVDANIDNITHCKVK